MIFVLGCLFHPRRPCPYAALAVEAGMVVHDGRVVDDGAVHVNVPHHRPVHVYHGGVVLEAIAIPTPAIKSNASIPKAVVNPAVEAHVGTPVARMPTVKPALEAPVPRRPQHAHSGRHDPYSGNPVV